MGHRSWKSAIRTRMFIARLQAGARLRRSVKQRITSANRDKRFAEFMAANHAAHMAPHHSSVSFACQASKHTKCFREYKGPLWDFVCTCVCHGEIPPDQVHFLPTAMGARPPVPNTQRRDGQVLQPVALREKRPRSILNAIRSLFRRS
jgi:hypothetical protein